MGQDSQIFFTLFDLKLVVRGVFWPLLMWLCSPVWCSGCCHVSIYLGVLVTEMLVSADKSGLCGFFLLGLASVSTLLVVLGGFL